MRSSLCSLHAAAAAAAAAAAEAVAAEAVAAEAVGKSWRWPQHTAAPAGLHVVRGWLCSADAIARRSCIHNVPLSLRLPGIAPANSTQKLSSTLPVTRPIGRFNLLHYDRLLSRRCCPKAKRKKAQAERFQASSLR
jgi:hypothetical protein